MSSFFPGFKSIDVPVRGCTIHSEMGGDGPPLLLLHGYPQTHVCWHKIAPRLASQFTVIAADLRGYGDSSKPDGGPGHENYSKRRMAADMAEMMSTLGFAQFSAAGHDRGGRVVQRLAQDCPAHVTKIAVLDIIPMTLEPDMFKKVDGRFGHDTYHWFFLSQPHDLPERLIGNDPGFYLRWMLESWATTPGWMTEDVFQEYLRTFKRPETIHATCEDYRAGVTADTLGPKPEPIRCPVLSLWGNSSKFGPRFDPVAYWRTQAETVEGRGVPGGHFIAEESPAEVGDALLAWFGR